MEKKKKSNGSVKKTPLARDNTKKNPRNKKIKNATPTLCKGVHLKSQLEENVYKVLKDAGFDVEYEPCKYVLWRGFRPKIPYYNKAKIDNRFKSIKLDKKKVMDITYTPDFQFRYKGYLIVIEAKGYETDVFMIKKKLFRQYLERNVPNSIYFEVYSKAHALQAVEIIKNL